MRERQTLYPLTPAEREHAKAAMRYLQEHFRNRPELQEIAAAIGIDGPMLQMLFRRRYGMSVLDALTQMQLDEGMRLMKSGMRITRIGPALGFSEPTHFGMKFKNYTGKTPRQWLRENRQPAGPITMT